MMLFHRSLSTIYVMVSYKEKNMRTEKCAWPNQYLPIIQVLVTDSHETRFARKSTHTNKADTGTATWEEFDQGLRADHSEHEREYTPDVFDSFKVLDWDRETDAFGDELGDYQDVKMSSTFQRIPSYRSMVTF